MPNWITNHLTVLDPTPEKTKEVFDALKTDNGEVFDFNTLASMPLNIANNPQKFEAWASVHWMTPTNAIQGTQNDDTVSFLTANTSPIILLEHLSTKFPNTRFRFRYADEDIGSNFGQIIFSGKNEFIYSPRPKDYSDEAIGWSLMLEGNHDWDADERLTYATDLRNAMIERNNND